MSLLPALFRQPDFPMTLGAKVVAPQAPKKVDPVVAFERGDHRVVGMLPGLVAPYGTRPEPLTNFETFKSFWRECNSDIRETWNKKLMIQKFQPFGVDLAKPGSDKTAMQMVLQQEQAERLVRESGRSALEALRQELLGRACGTSFEESTPFKNSTRYRKD